jgi:hypothetical protein
VLQQSLHMFPGVELKISPNGLYRLFVSAHPLMISARRRIVPQTPSKLNSARTFLRRCSYLEGVRSNGL